MESIYQMVCEANRSLIQDEPLPDEKRRHIIDAMLQGICGTWLAERFRRGVNAPEESPQLYPMFYIPPYNSGKKFRLITGELPKTHILSANHYELEVLRLLTLWLPNHPTVMDMADKTLERLEAACFARFCEKGECVGAGVAALRFLSVVKPGEDPWIGRLLQPLGELFLASGGSVSVFKKLPVYYFLLTLNGLTDEYAAPYVRRHKDYLIKLLFKGQRVGPAEIDTYNPLRKSILRRALCRLPDCAYLMDTHVYISEEDGRCYCG